ncbi:hypothetical protein QFZ79_000072 [Arthrobacter sp. V4I6]|nr:hypothetical protein [Arthrobacter sp. V1I7]MDQ0851961.1 hypothetical protein [Arthrobacter sp. V4I6]
MSGLPRGTAALPRPGSLLLAPAGQPARAGPRHQRPAGGAAPLPRRTVPVQSADLRQRRRAQHPPAGLGPPGRPAARTLRGNGRRRTRLQRRPPGPSGAGGGGFGQRMKVMLDAYIAAAGIDAHAAEAAPADDWLPAESGARLDLDAEGSTSVISSTDYGLDFGVLDIPVLDEWNYPRHSRGATEGDGLYTVGLSWLTRHASSTVALGRGGRGVRRGARCRAVNSAHQPRQAPSRSGQVRSGTGIPFPCLGGREDAPDVRVRPASATLPQQAPTSETSAGSCSLTTSTTSCSASAIPTVRTSSPVRRPSTWTTGPHWRAWLRE